jgi:hypothetical protein
MSERRGHWSGRRGPRGSLAASCAPPECRINLDLASTAKAASQAPEAAAAPRAAGDGSAAEEATPAGRPELTASTSSSEPTERDRGNLNAPDVTPDAATIWQGWRSRPASWAATGPTVGWHRLRGSRPRRRTCRRGLDVRGSRRTRTARRADVEEQCQVRTRPCALNRVTARPGGT